MQYLIFCQLLATLVLVAAHANKALCDEDADTWEYEPRVWWPDQEDNFEAVNYEFDLSQVESGPSDIPKKQFYAFQNDPSEQIRAESYLWESRKDQERVLLEKEFEKRSSTTRRKSIRQQQNQEQTTDKCTQFRVDIRETVICDKKRCDKFEFEWPKYDNQILHIQTTKYGMRFYKAEYAFDTHRSATQVNGSPKQSLLNGRSREVVKSSSLSNSNRQSNQDSSQIRRREQVKIVNKQGGDDRTRLKPVKFDLFEFFKPKTTTTNPTTTTTGSTTMPPLTSVLPSTETTTESPSSNGTTTTDSPSTATTTTVTTTEAEPSSTTEPIEDPENNEPLDNNSTRLITSYRLNTKNRVQPILGFGGALSDSTCRNIKSLSPDMAKSLMEDYFGQRGLRYNIARMSMGSSDFSTTPYTNNDADDDQQQQTNSRLLYDGVGQDDVEMKKFRLVDEDYEFKLPIARQAIATSRQEIKFFSSLWSPPTWMKNNSNIVHGYLKGDVYGPYYKALADYMVKWLEAYRKNGIEFWATTGLNEPVTGVLPFIFHNSLGIARDDYVTFIKLYLGPMLRQRGFNQIKLIAMDDNKGYAPQLARSVLQDKEASKYVSGIGVHWYMNDDYGNLNFLSQEFPDKFILSTEACNGYLPFQVHTLPGDWDRGVAYMYDIIKMLQKNAVGWVDWNMVLDIGGGPSWAKNNLDAPIIVNPERDEYYKSPSFYAIGHFSRFIEPNSTRLDHRLANARFNRPLESVAFYTPKEYVVIVVLNTNKHQVPFRIIVDRQLVKMVTLREESFNTIVFKWKSKN